MALTSLKGTNAFGDYQFSEQIEANVMSYLDWGLLTIGGYFNISIPASGAYGGDQSRLRMAVDPNYTNGQVWESFRSNWVWESGVNIKGAWSEQPLQASGVTVNSTFHHKSVVGAFSHTLNFPNGRVVFNTAIATSSTVQTTFSYRWTLIRSTHSQEFRQLMFGSMRVDDDNFLQTGSGNWSQHPSTRVQMPAVFVEVMGNREFTGLQLGGGQIITQDVVFHIFCENKWDRDKLVDIIANQNRTAIHLFDLKGIADASRFPLDALGSISSGALTYPDLITDYLWRKAFIIDANVQNVVSTLPLHRGQVRWSLEVDMPDI